MKSSKYLTENQPYLEKLNSEFRFFYFKLARDFLQNLRGISLNVSGEFNE